MAELFEDIEGYEDIKEMIKDNLQDGRKPVHFLLWGPPGTAKTLFLEELAKLPGAVRTLGGAATRVGLTEALAAKTPWILIIDEIDKSKREDLGVLLSLMESQRIRVDKHNEHLEINLDGTRVFAAANRIKKLPEELLSRFVRLYFRPYSREEFIKVGMRVLAKEGYDASFAQSAAARCWNSGVTDIRQLRQIARLAGCKERIPQAINLVVKYK